MTVWPQPGTDCAKLLDALADGAPHSFRDLYRLGLMVHSRTADLRRRGYVIQVKWGRNKFGDRDYLYTLVSCPAPATKSPPDARGGPVAGDEAGAGDDTGRQLTLDEALA
jgi:hypothetical protein